MDSDSKFGYITTIGRNIEAVNKTQLSDFYNDLLKADLIITCAEGRSRYVLNMACSEMAKMENGKEVIDRRDTGFRGRNMMEALPVYTKSYDNILLLINSGSGGSLIPKIAAEETAKYIQKNGSDNIKIDAITSTPNSPIGEIAQQYGHMLKIKGREKTEGMSDEKLRQSTGFMGDLFELGSGGTLFKVCKVMHDKKPIDYFYELHKELYPEIIKRIDHISESEEMKFLVKELTQRHIPIFCGIGSGNDVARTINVRTMHVKRSVGSESYVVGESSTPNAMPGDLLIPILENDPEVDRTMAEWCKLHKKLDGVVVCVSESKNLESVRLADYSIIVEDTPRTKGAPNMWYNLINYVLSPLPLLMIEYYGKFGLNIPEPIMRYYHASVG